MTDSVVFASGGSHTRTTPGESGSIASIRPGPWCEKPLWSLRQHVEVSSTFSDGTDARHGSVLGVLQPLHVLHRHRGRDHRERLVRREHPVPARQRVPLQPALAQVLAEHLHHPAVGTEVVVGLQHREHERPVGHLEHRLQPVARRLVGREQPERVRGGVQVAHQLPRRHRVADQRPPAPLELHLVRRQLDRRQRLAQPAVRVRRRGHPLVADGRERPELGDEPAGLVEQRLRRVRPQPFLQHPQVLGVLGQARQRHLVRAEGALHLDAVDHVGAGPALRRAQDDRRPPGLDVPRPDPPVCVAQARRTAPGTPHAGRHPRRRRGPSPGCAGTPSTSSSEVRPRTVGPAIL